MITKEDFWKLKQSDRIEYFLLNEHYNKKYETGCAIGLFYFMFVLLFVYLAFALLFYPINPDSTTLMLSSFPTIFFIMVIGFCLGLIFDVYNLIKHKEKINELIRRYFKIQPK